MEPKALKRQLEEDFELEIFKEGSLAHGFGIIPFQRFGRMVLYVLGVAQKRGFKGLDALELQRHVSTINKALNYEPLKSEGFYDVGTLLLRKILDYCEAKHWVYRFEEAYQVKATKETVYRALYSLTPEGKHLSGPKCLEK